MLSIIWIHMSVIRCTEFELQFSTCQESKILVFCKPQRAFVDEFHLHKLRLVSKQDNQQDTWCSLLNARAEYWLTSTRARRLNQAVTHKECFREPYSRQRRICQRWSGCGLDETSLVRGLAYRKWVSNNTFLLTLCVDICHLTQRSG